MMNTKHEPATQARLLLVEDDAALAEVTTDLLRSYGHCVVHANSVRKALELARSREFDLAVLDVNVDNHLVFPVARKLGIAGVPFMFMSGTPGTAVPSEFRGHPFLFKPYRPRDMLRTLSTLTLKAGQAGMR